MAQVGQGFDAASPASQHDAVYDGAGVGPLDGVAEEPGFSARCKNPDVTLKNVVVDRHSAVLRVAGQIVPLVQGIGDCIAELAVRQDLSARGHRAIS